MQVMVMVMVMTSANLTREPNPWDNNLKALVKTLVSS
jgi:hypothetical protein